MTYHLFNNSAVHCLPALIAVALLAGCSGDETTVVASAQQATESALIPDTAKKVQAASAQESVGLGNAEAVQSAPADMPAPAMHKAPEAVYPDAAPAVAVLPTGRLSGIVTIDGEFRAYVATPDNTITLRQGDNWQGWTVNVDKPDALTLVSGATQHVLRLNQSIAPTATTQAGQQRAARLPVAESGDLPADPLIRLTQAQRVKMQQNLLSIH